MQSIRLALKPRSSRCALSMLLYAMEECYDDRSDALIQLLAALLITRMPADWLRQAGLVGDVPSTGYTATLKEQRAWARELLDGVATPEVAQAVRRAVTERGLFRNGSAGYLLPLGNAIPMLDMLRLIERIDEDLEAIPVTTAHAPDHPLRAAMLDQDAFAPRPTPPDVLRDHGHIAPSMEFGVIAACRARYRAEGYDHAAIEYLLSRTLPRLLLMVRVDMIAADRLPAP